MTTAHPPSRFGVPLTEALAPILPCCPTAPGFIVHNDRSADLVVKRLASPTEKERCIVCDLSNSTAVGNSAQRHQAECADEGARETPAAEVCRPRRLAPGAGTSQVSVRETPSQPRLETETDRGVQRRFVGRETPTGLAVRGEGVAPRAPERRVASRASVVASPSS